MPSKKQPKQPYTREDARRTGAEGGHTSWARTKDRSARTAPAREAGPTGDRYWMNKVDPNHEMSEADRRKAAQNARKAHCLRMARKSVEVRRARKAAAEAAAREAAQQQASEQSGGAA